MPDRQEIHTMKILLTDVIMIDIMNLLLQGKEQLHPEIPIMLVHLLESLWTLNTNQEVELMKILNPDKDKLVLDIMTENPDIMIPVYDYFV